MIAFVAYPWQKGRDRELKIAEEKRSAYREFFSAAEELNSLFSSSPGGKIDDGVRKAQSRLDASKSGLALLASPEGLKACEHLYAALQNLRNCSEEFQRIFIRTQKELEREAEETDREWAKKVLRVAVKTPEGEAWAGVHDEISSCRLVSIIAARNDCDLESHHADLTEAIQSLFDFPRARKRTKPKTK